MNLIGNLWYSQREMNFSCLGKVETAKNIGTVQLNKQLKVQKKKEKFSLMHEKNSQMHGKEGP